MDRSLLSILIPTFNRASYLEYLLKFISDEIYQFDYPYEILISDNASGDNTKEVLDSFKNKLNFTAYHQKSNIREGSFDFLIEKAKGEYFIYLADDDKLDFELLNLAFEKLQSKSNAICLYTPWQIWDFKENKSLGLFYDAPELEVQKNDFYELGKFMIKNKVFAEIGIFKTKIFKKILPFYLDNFFFAFKYPLELITQGNIIFSNIPFYKSLVHFDLDKKKENRHQDGFAKTKTIYYKYSNSLYHILRLMNVNHDENIRLKKYIDEFMYQRLNVALDLCCRNMQFIEAYELASIIIGKFNQFSYRISFENIREFAKLKYVEKVIHEKKITNLILIYNEKEKINNEKFYSFFKDSNFKIYENEVFNSDTKCLYYFLDNSSDFFSKENLSEDTVIIYDEIVDKKFI